MKYRIILFALFLFTIFQLSSQNLQRYIITVNNVEVYSLPDRTSARAEHQLVFGTIVTPEKIIRNDYDYNYLMIRINGKQLYLPQEMCVLLEKDPEDTVLRYESHKAYPGRYIPDELTLFDESYSFNKNGVYLRNEMFEDLKKFIDKAGQEGYTLKAAAGYSDLENRIKEYEKAIHDDPKQTYISPPLESDYGSGLCVDFTDALIGPNYKKYFHTYKLWQWLSDNAAEYNFVPTDRPYKFLYSAPHLTDTGKISWKYRIILIMNQYRIRIYHGKPSPYFSFLWIHNNEKSAGRTLSYAHDKYGGNSVTVINGGKRNIPVNFGKKTYFIDPNRIFTDRGIDRYLRKFYRASRSASAVEIKKRMKEFRKHLIENLDWSEEKYLISLHSSLKDSDFSMEDFTNSSKYRLHRNKSHNPKNFFFVTRERDYDYLSKLDFNTVYQKEIDDDGSLSIYAHYRKFPYINIEVIEGDEYFQKKMLDAVISHIIKNGTEGGSK